VFQATNILYQVKVIYTLLELTVSCLSLLANKTFIQLRMLVPTGIT